MNAIANAPSIDTRRKELLRKAEIRVQAEMTARKYDRSLVANPADLRDSKHRQEYISRRVQAVYKSLVKQEPKESPHQGFPPLLIDRLETISTSVPQLVKLFRARELQLLGARNSVTPSFAASFDRNVIFLGLILPCSLFIMAFGMAAAVPSRLWVLPLFMAVAAQALSVWKMRDITCSSDPSMRRHRYLAWCISGLHTVTITVMFAAILTAGLAVVSIPA